MGKKERAFRVEYLLMLIAALFWALGHPFGKIALREVHPFQLGAFNLIVGFFSLKPANSVEISTILSLEGICINDLLFSMPKCPRFENHKKSFISDGNMSVIASRI